MMQAYHDEEWGVPERDPRALWEMLMLEGFQAGLSWAIVLRKRDAFRQAFARFEPKAVAQFGARDVNRLMKNPGLIRARAKIEATVAGARAFCEMSDRGENFADFCWAFSDGHVVTGNGRRCRRRPRSPNDLERAEATRVQVRRSHDRLRLDAGRRHRQRSRARLLSTRSGGDAPGLTHLLSVSCPCLLSTMPRPHC